MRRSYLIAVIVAMPAIMATGQQGGSVRPSGLVAVSVHAPSSQIKEPRLLPLNPPLKLARDCDRRADGEVVVSLLVDTKGRSRNVMFVQPAGSAIDRIAIQIASRDRFEPGTLDGKPVVVAENLRIKLETCDSEMANKAGSIALHSVLRSIPRQKLEKPEDPPEEAILTPASGVGSKRDGVVRRPDFFGGAVSAPVILYSQDAEYLPAQNRSQIAGVCQVGLVVDEHGLPENVHVIKSIDPGLDLSAVQAVSMYRFFPAIRNGEEPVPAAIVVSVSFTPPKARSTK